MQGFLLDTNICVFLFRGKYGVVDIINRIGKDMCYISEITVAELKYGVQCSSNKTKNARILSKFLEDINVIPFEAAIDLYAEEKARLRSLGTPVDDFDLLIGCTAVSCDLTLVTENIKHFLRIRNINMENWILR